MNTGESEPGVDSARHRVLKIQTKLHRWARDDGDRRFDDLFYLVADPDFLVVAWDRVSGNRGSGTAGIDGLSALAVSAFPGGVDGFLAGIRDLGPRTQSKRVEIRLRDDYLVISNPGGLWGVSKGQLGTPNGKSAVNEFLYDVCKFTRTNEGHRVIEGEGGGIRESRLVLRKAGMRPPEFQDTAVRFTARISRHALLSEDDLAWLGVVAADAPLSDMQREILASMRGAQEWTNALVREEFAYLGYEQLRPRGHPSQDRRNNLHR